MTLLDAAKALAKDDACFRDVIDDGTIVSRCVFCLWVPLHEGHHPDCEWPMLPQIVAALEAAAKTLHSLEHFPLTEEDIRIGYTGHILSGMKKDLLAALTGAAPSHDRL